MIKAVLLDLDDTLIQTGTEAFFSRYLWMLAGEFAHLLPPEKALRQIMAAYEQALDARDPTRPLYDRFLENFSALLRRDPAELKPLFERFYAGRYPELRPLVHPRPATSGLLSWLFERGYRVAVATDPAVPLTTILQRMDWGGISPEAYPFALITCLETMHFGKPQPEYYGEILLRLDVEPHEAIMVGDRWTGDIAAAAQIGLNVYWVSGDGAPPPEDGTCPDGYGSYERFVSLVQSGWLETLPPRSVGREALLVRLAVFPAAIDDLRRSYPPDVLECNPAEGEWSARDIVCHLRDYAAEEDRVRLERILSETNPFLSANYDPWARASEYARVSLDEAFEEFARLRAEMVAWLRGLPPDVWQRPARHAIFGPTTFGEMVHFTAQHDRTHLRQMRHAIETVLHACSEGTDSG